MMLYALGGLAAYGYIYEIETVRMSIIQPRLENISTLNAAGKTGGLGRKYQAHRKVGL
jgi:hypothetical protein